LNWCSDYCTNWCWINWYIFGTFNFDFFFISLIISFFVIFGTFNFDFFFISLIISFFVFIIFIIDWVDRSFGNWCKEITININSSCDWCRSWWFQRYSEAKYRLINFWNNSNWNISSFSNINSANIFNLVGSNDVFGSNIFRFNFANWNVSLLIYNYRFNSLVKNWCKCVSIYFNNSVLSIFLGCSNWLVCENWCIYFWYNL